MKKTLAFILVLCLVCFSISFAIGEEEKQEYKSGNYTFTLDENGNAEITGWNGKADTLTIPSTLDGHTVTAIGDFTFNFCYSLASITIPDSVTSIGERAFYSCPLSKVIVTKGSYAAEWAKNNNLPYSYPDSNDWLNN
ncbi:MAG: leucine-rich repeat protein [Eubacteriales bacterium]|nr:leucine-rich repeat protein [Eubacteriales bacterium]MDD3881324.1 leucine-rich repeat protein [Eubacteriales bacterium]MDD4513700.1 leucine-rich repeat protein [Eubacteriales bacterium]